jgi:hypothetical protein
MDGEMRGYLSGPLEPIGDYKENVEAMKVRAAQLDGENWLITNPACNPQHWSREQHQRANIAVICKPSGSTGLYHDAMLMMPRWELSLGCRIEKAVADEIGLRTLDAMTMQPIDKHIATLVSTAGMVRIDIPAGHEKAVEIVRQKLTPHQERMRDLFDEAFKLFRRKNNDYGNSMFESPFLNPMLPPGAAIAVRASDKLARLRNLAKSGTQEVNESVRETVIDLIVYFAASIVSEEYEPDRAVEA